MSSKIKFVLIIIIVFSVVVLCFFSVNWIPECVFFQIEKGKTILLVLNIIISMTIALVLFEKYGFRKKLDSKEQDLVLSLRDFLCRNTILITIKESEFNSYSFHNLYKDCVSDNVLLLNNDKKPYKLLFTDDFAPFISGLENYSHNPSVPDVIRERIIKIQGKLFLQEPLDPKGIDSLEENYVLLRLNEYEIGTITQRLWNVSTEISVFKYLELWVDLRNLIETWIFQNSKKWS